MKLLFIFLAFGFSFLLFNSCHERGPLFPDPALGLGLRDFSCTEAWIEVQVGNNDKTANIYIKKNDEIIKTITLGQSDSLFYFDNLQPNTSYKFDAVTYDDGKEIKSNPVTFTTLDTTSHNFTWQTFTFGQHQHSVLYDVAIIDENNIWAVGAIYMNDSIGNPDLTPYNAIHWDGNDWEIIRIPTKTFSGSIVSSQIRTIFSFSENNIWTFSISGSYSNWNGNIWKTEFVNERDGSGNKFLGINSSNLFLVCNNGGISFYNGTNWQKIESGTTVNLLNISVTPDGNTIWACGYTDDYGTSALIKIKDGVVEKVFEGLSNSQNNGYYVGPMSGVWSDNEYRVFMMNWGGIYLQQNNNQLFLEKEIARFSDAGFGIDGTDYNNVFACGEGFVGHWNGYTYIEYPELFRQQRTFKSVKADANTVCAVGLDYNSPIYSNAVIVIGKE